MERAMNDFGDCSDNEMYQLVSAIANGDRLKILGILAGGEVTVEQLASEICLDSTTLGMQLAILGRAGLITTRKDAHRRLLSLRHQATSALEAWGRNRLAPDLARTDTVDSVPPSVRHFFDGHRLKSFPARHSRKLDVLSVLIGDFDPEKDYSEADVNQILLERHPDFATLRRALIDEGMMNRAGGVYRRVG
jgi:hypothetical protein